MKLALAALVVAGCAGRPAAPTIPAAARAAQARIVLEDRVPLFWRRTIAAAFLDGESLPTPPPTGRGPLTLFAGPLAPGRHELALELVYQGAPFGVFTYSHYRVRVRARHFFSLAPAEARRIDLVVRDRGPITTPVDRRFAVDARESVDQDRHAGQ